MFDKKTLGVIFGLIGILAIFYFISRTGELKQFFTLPGDDLNATNKKIKSEESSGSGQSTFSDLLETPTPTPTP